MENCCNTPRRTRCEPQNLCTIVAPVFMEYEAQLKAFVLKRVQDKDEANEVLQQLYLKLYKNCEQLQEVHHIKAWLYQITRNAVYDFFREHSRYESIDENYLEKADLPEQPRRDLEELVLPLINLLPAEYAEPLRLSDLEGVSQKEIAERLGMSYSGAKSRVQRGREKLKQLFMECCHLEFSHNGQIVGAQVKAGCKPLGELRESSFNF
ncbi:RNA polymerase sigma factor SigZ [Pontibacter silvestris]|uniref:RNA polymerase sigma factor SigZ n=1 Tax=Pontibacter silvestris TaxID=2305183 RepID=A0ABW4WYQ7_9BACT|nr:RNA polymerase sigma factor SigZ [Pontibacter silvestris]MCC9136706.1 RNA polymerase sigma factor SigZ [Pontibacter silvestris]